MVSIEYSTEAINDIENIFEIILADKPNIANEYISRLENFIDLLALNAKMGVACKNKGIKFDCRIAVFDQYKIFYQISSSEIFILRVIHSRQHIENTKLN